jgi:Uma2 family endonuclease
MSVRSPQNHFSLEEYFALEKASERRWEYWDGEVVCMSGGSQEHGLICSNLQRRLNQVFERSLCRVFTEGVPIHTPSLPPYRYPDASVTCGNPEFLSVGGIDALINPVLIVEVLSPGTEAADRGAKFDAYKTIPSLRKYLLIESDSRYVVHYVKPLDGGWEGKAHIDGALTLASIDRELAIEEIYEGVSVGI